MSIARSFGPVAEQMTKALEQYSKEELVDLMTHIVKTYVVEGTLPLKPELGSGDRDAKLSSLSFPQLILHLQMHLEHREWSQFSVSGEDVWVSVGGQRLNLTGRQAPTPTLAPEGQTTRIRPTSPIISATAGIGSPAAQTSQAPPAQPSEPAPMPPVLTGSSSGRQTQRTSIVEEQEPPDSEQKRDDGLAVVADKDVEASERFGMLEFD